MPQAPFTPPPIGPWAWRLLPLLALLSIGLAWDTWRSAPAQELAIRATLENHAVEWAYAKGITGKAL